jgi:hypothetical protein
MSTKAAAAKVTADEQVAFGHVFDSLRAILLPYSEGEMRVVHDTPQYYYLETTFPVYRGKPVMFACVRRGKAYVSYHLLPLYMNPPLNRHVSAELQRRKQGKACFNFAKPDEKLFAELADLTRLGLESFKKFAQTGVVPKQTKGSLARKSKRRPGSTRH